jgi:hypothetical protein
MAVAWGPSGYVIAGESGPSAAIWHSTDLQSWQLGAGDDLTGKSDARRWMRGVVAGTFGDVAVGALEVPASPQNPLRRRPAVWTSPDGGQWAMQQLPLPQGSAEAWLDRVIAQGGTLVATGTASTSSGLKAFAFLSSDGGKTWQEVPLPSTGTQRHEVQVTAATAIPGGFVIAASDQQGLQEDVVLWNSRDGRSWQLERPQGTGLSGPGDQWLSGMTVFGGRLLAVGLTSSSRGEQPTLWHRPLQ